MTLAEHVRARAGNLLVGSSNHGSWAEVWLRADATALAEELHAEHGDALVIHVGCLRYPFDRSRSWTPEAAPVSTVELPGLRAKILLDREITPTGQSVSGRVRLTSADAVSFMTAAWHFGYLVESRGRVIAGAGMTFRNANGEHVNIARRGIRICPSPPVRRALTRRPVLCSSPAPTTWSSRSR